jgi:hypothetical protein
MRILCEVKLNEVSRFKRLQQYFPRFSRVRVSEFQKQYPAGNRLAQRRFQYHDPEITFIRRIIRWDFGSRNIIRPNSPLNNPGLNFHLTQNDPRSDQTSEFRQKTESDNSLFKSCHIRMLQKIFNNFMIFLRSIPNKRESDIFS